MVKATLTLLAAALLSNAAQAYVIKVNAHDGKVKTYDIHGTNLTANEFLSDPKPVSIHSEVEERDLICGTETTYFYELIGDGNPHQNYKIAELGNTITPCPGQITKGDEHSTSWSIGADLSIDKGIFQFLSLNFAVEQSSSQYVEHTYTCSSTPGTDMSNICVLAYTAVTAVTVAFKSRNKCGAFVSVNDLGTGVVYLPNANGVGSTTSRGANFADRNIIQCRGMDREIDYFCGPPGGPEWFTQGNHEPGPWTDAWMASFDQASCGAAPIEALKFND